MDGENSEGAKPEEVVVSQEATQQNPPANRLNRAFNAMSDKLDQLHNTPVRGDLQKTAKSLTTQTTGPVKAVAELGAKLTGGRTTK